MIDNNDLDITLFNYLGSELNFEGFLSLFNLNSYKDYDETINSETNNFSEIFIKFDS